MGNAHDLTKENLLFAFPASLRENPSIAALGEVTMEALANRPEEIGLISLYPRIDELPEQLLDILAYDFKVDWWDADYSVEEKRRTLKSSWRVHKLLGTKAAIETALRAIYPKSWVEPWFEYKDGEPYHFRIHIDLTGEKMIGRKPMNVMERVGFYQSLRDHLDSIQYTIVLPPSVLRVGGNGGIHARAGMRQEADSFSFSRKVHVGGVFAARARLPVRENTGQPSATTILRTGGVCTIISNMSKGEK